MFLLYKRTLKNPVKIIIHISHPYCKSIHRIASKDAPGGQTSGAENDSAETAPVVCPPGAIPGAINFIVGKRLQGVVYCGYASGKMQNLGLRFWYGY